MKNTDVLQQLGDRINNHKQKVYDDREREQKGQPNLYNTTLIEQLIVELQWTYQLLQDSGFEEPKELITSRKKEQKKGILNAIRRKKPGPQNFGVRSESKMCERCNKDNAMLEPNGETKYCTSCLVVLRDEHLSKKEQHDIDDKQESVSIIQTTRRCYLCGSPHNELEQWREYDVCKERMKCKPPAML